MAGSNTISMKQIRRLPLYLKYLQDLDNQNVESITAQLLSKKFLISEDQIRKDLQLVSEGRPGRKRGVKQLIENLRIYLGYNDIQDCILIGVGHLGKAFMNYNGFISYGLEIVKSFDNKKSLIGKKIGDVIVESIDHLEEVIVSNNIKIAILTTPIDVAQEITNKLVNAGIKAIWNFTNQSINVPDDVIVEYVNLASSLAVLSHKLKKEEK